MTTEGLPFLLFSLEIVCLLAYLRLRIKVRTAMRLWGNDYNKMEFAGAFGDLGTLIPFVVGYITLNKMDPFGNPRRLRSFQDLRRPLFQDSHSCSAHEGHWRDGHRPCWYDHAGNDLGIRDLYRPLLASDGSHRRDQLD